VVGNLNGIKPNEGVVKCSEGLSNRMSITIRRHTDHMFIYIILLVLFCIIVFMVVCFV
jgi:hypothetical protein